MFESVIVFIITNIFWIYLLKGFPEIIINIYKDLIGNKMVYVKRSMIDNTKIGLYMNINIEQNREIIKYLNKDNHILHYGNFVITSKNKLITNCYLRKKVDGYYLVSKRDIRSNEELAIELC